MPKAEVLAGETAAAANLAVAALWHLIENGHTDLVDQIEAEAIQKAGTQFIDIPDDRDKSLVKDAATAMVQKLVAAAKANHGV